MNLKKLNFDKNSNCDKTQNIKMWKNLKTQIVRKKTLIVKKLNYSMWPNSNCEKTQKLKLWQNLKYDQSQFITRKTNLNILTPWQPIQCSLGSVLQFLVSFQVWLQEISQISSFQNKGPWNWGMDILVACITFSMDFLVSLNMVKIMSLYL